MLLGFELIVGIPQAVAEFGAKVDMASLKYFWRLLTSVKSRDANDSRAKNQPHLRSLLPTEDVLRSQRSGGMSDRTCEEDSADSSHAGRLRERELGEN